MANSVDPDHTAPIGAVCYGSMLFASILNSSVMLGNFLQQTTFQMHFKGQYRPRYVQDASEKQLTNIGALAITHSINAHQKVH